MSWSGLLGFSGTAMVLLALPGPSVLFVVTRGVVLGRRAAPRTSSGSVSERFDVAGDWGTRWSRLNRSPAGG
jgi:threonine/homoserine/homoserine lactone efflux protein